MHEENFRCNQKLCSHIEARSKITVPMHTTCLMSVVIPSPTLAETATTIYVRLVNIGGFRNLAFQSIFWFIREIVLVPSKIRDFKSFSLEVIERKWRLGLMHKIVYFKIVYLSKNQCSIFDRYLIHVVISMSTTQRSHGLSRPIFLEAPETRDTERLKATDSPRRQIKECVMRVDGVIRIENTSDHTSIAGMRDIGHLYDGQNR
ncbi:hypothetical protein K501DRAFT_275924 [Backusella circina FSU 941]|nr:hypothetical protein K501DRAFT_275924 [Backusella circina FSU 941]